MIAESGARLAGQITTGIVIVLLAAAAVALYWLPTFVARRRHVKNLGSIVTLNVFGFVGVTWIIALAWAFSDSTKG